jgi:hypothetical protein
MQVICIGSEPEYFCEGDWTTQISLNWLNTLLWGRIAQCSVTRRNEKWRITLSLIRPTS